MNKKKIPKLTHEKLLLNINYDEKTGKFNRLSQSKRLNANGEVGFIRLDGYRQISVLKESFLAHRLAWFYVYKEWPKLSLDHINEIKDDNRIENLREATLTENNFNVTKYSHNTSGFKGVGKTKLGKFRAYISINNKHVNLGTFDTPEEAYEVYCAKVKETRGEFGKL